MVPRGLVACYPRPQNGGRLPPPPLPCPPPRTCPPPVTALRCPVVVSELLILVLFYRPRGSRLFGARQVFVPSSVRIHTWSRTRCVTVVALLLFSTSSLSQFAPVCWPDHLICDSNPVAFGELVCRPWLGLGQASCGARNCASYFCVRSFGDFSSSVRDSMASSVSIYFVTLKKVFFSKQNVVKRPADRPYGKA